MVNLHILSEIFDLRLKLFALVSGTVFINNIFADIFDVAGKAGTLPMQGLLLACIVLLGGVIVWQNRGREALNKERHEENKKAQEKNEKNQQELLGKLTAQQASIDAERVARIGKLMEQQRDDIEAKKELAFAMRELAQSSNANSRVIGELQTVVSRLVDHLDREGRRP